MKEIIELRINIDYANLLFQEFEGKKIGSSIKVIEITKDDPRYQQIPLIAEEVKRKYDRTFFYGWKIKRKYSKKVIENAELLQLKIKSIFEPTGEECGTIFDESESCDICGANRIQISPLILKKGTIPKKDIAKTIGGEVIVSDRFLNAVKRRNLKGLKLSPTNLNKYYQLNTDAQIELTLDTVSGINIFDLSSSDEGEIYKCPMGHTIGLNLLSEAYVLKNELIANNDFIKSKQKIGVKRGLLRPEPIYFCSQAFRLMIEEEKLRGFEFEAVNIN
jgi:hypothetical protein